MLQDLLEQVNVEDSQSHRLRFAEKHHKKAAQNDSEYRHIDDPNAIIDKIFTLSK